MFDMYLKWEMPKTKIWIIASTSKTNKKPPCLLLLLILVSVTVINIAIPAQMPVICFTSPYIIYSHPIPK